MDFAKAFDKVSHRALLMKLELYGFDGMLVNWIKDFLTGRRQRVVMGEAVSDWLDVFSGVPQGSVLGPLLFVIFINDMPDVVKCLCKLFADDTKLISIIKNPLDLTSLQLDVDSLVEWSNKWLMNFNEEKCKFMAINNKHFNIDITMNGKPLKSTDNERDLGIVLCSNLKWDHQATLAANTASTVLWQLSKAFKFLSIKSFRSLYVAFVRPHLEYAITAWCPHTKKSINILEKVQIRATKLVKSIKDLSYEKRLEILDLSTLRERRERADLIEYFKFSKGLSIIDWHNPNKLTNSLSIEGPARSIRGEKHRLVKQNTRISQREHFLSNRVIDNWNRLPADIISVENKNSFKKKIDDFFKANKK